MREPDVGLGEPTKKRPMISADAERQPVTPPTPPPPPSQGQIKYQDEGASKPRSSWLPWGIVFVVFMGVGAGFIGFFVGDSFGREHAQYNNPLLRDHYVGQCFNYVDNQLKKSLREGLNKAPVAVASPDLNEISQKLESIREALMNINQGEAPKGGKTAQLPVKTQKQLSRLLNLLSTRHVELVSDRCPASNRLPQKYSNRG